MKSLFPFVCMLTLMLALGSCQSKHGNAPVAGSSVVGNGQAQWRFDTDMHDFGDVIEGEKVSYAFKFTNAGKGPLVITSIASSCGCTVGDYTKDTIKPGAQGEVTVSFDSYRREGFQQKSVTVNANTNPSFQILRIKATVRPAKNN